MEPDEFVHKTVEAFTHYTAEVAGHINDRIASMSSEGWTFVSHSVHSNKMGIFIWMVFKKPK